MNGYYLADKKIFISLKREVKTSFSNNNQSLERSRRRRKYGWISIKKDWKFWQENYKGSKPFHLLFLHF